MMPRNQPIDVLRRAHQRLFASYRHGPSRLRLRWRLYLISAPLIILLLAVAAKMISVVVIGNSAISNFDHHDIEALRSDVSMLEFVNVIDPAKTSFANGDLMVLEGRLDDAEERFQESLTRTDHGASCPGRVNLELVQETLGDIATRGGRKDDAERWYHSAIAVVNDAPANCFADNDDPVEDRRAIRAEALPRLQQKLKNLELPPKPPPPPPDPIAPPPPPTSLTQMTSAPPLPHLAPAPAPGGEDEDSEQAPAPGGEDEDSEQAPAAGEDGEQAPAAGEDGEQAPAPGEGAPPPGPGPNMPTQPAPAPTMTPGPGPGPGPNMPTPPTAQGGEAPVVGPEGGGADVLNPVSPDRLPSIGAGGPPGQQLGIGSGDPLEQLRKLLDNANAHGDNRE